MSESFSKSKSLVANVKVELDFSNYAKKKTDLKNTKGVDTSSSAKNDLGNLMI